MITETTKLLRSALKSAKTGSIDKAQALVSALYWKLLSVEDLRTLALVYSYCGQETNAERVWEQVCAREDVAPGDHFMLGSTQLALGYSERAIGSLRRELATGDDKGDSRYMVVTAINLAFLLSVRGERDQALQILQRLADTDGTHVHGVGLLTKRDLIGRLQD